MNGDDGHFDRHGHMRTPSSLFSGGVSRSVKEPAWSLVTSGILCTIVTLAFVWSSQGCRHWFVIPVLLCGVMVAVDALDWLFGRIDAFDPVGLIGVLGVHFFFMAPLLQASQGYWAEQWTLVVTPPPDWRPWVGYLAALTVPGLLIYRAVIRRFDRRPIAQPGVAKRIDDKLLLRILFSGMALSLVLQILVYWSFGGLEGYIHQFVDLRIGPGSGLGRLFVISESFPLLAAMAFAVWARKRPRFHTIPVLAAFFAFILMSSLLFGGLRGSRSMTVWVLFLAAGLVHFLVRRIPRRTIGLGLLFIAVFMYVYGFFKWGGTDAFTTMANHSARTEWSARTQKTMLRTLVFDLSRTNVQAYLLYRLSLTEDYEFGRGRTYLGALALTIPRSIWPNRPPAKEKEGSALQFDAESGLHSTWIYGLSGEAILNFGPIGVPLSFLPLGLLAGFSRRLAGMMQPGDYRWLLQPLLVALCLQVLAFDSSNIVVFFCKNGLVMIGPVAICLFLQARRTPQSPLEPCDESGTRENDE